jgi:hypothetical protein
MSNITEFVVAFDESVRKRHYHEKGKGRITSFVVQLEVFHRGEWRVVIRYDCAHGFSHLDKYDINGNRTKETLNLSFESALNYGDWDVNENWERYKEEFLRGEQDR